MTSEDKTADPYERLRSESKL